MPRGTLLRPICFLFHISDLRTTSDIVKYVDNSSLREVSAISAHSQQLQWSANEASGWAAINKMALNCDKTKEMAVCFARGSPAVPPIVLVNTEIVTVQRTKLLGVMLSNDLKWQGHVDCVRAKGFQRLYFRRMLKRAGVGPKNMVRIYVSLVR